MYQQSDSKPTSKNGLQNGRIKREKRAAYITLYGPGDLYPNKRFPNVTAEYRGHFQGEKRGIFHQGKQEREQLPHESPRNSLKPERTPREPREMARGRTDPPHSLKRRGSGEQKTNKGKAPPLHGSPGLVKRKRTESITPGKTENLF